MSHSNPSRLENEQRKMRERVRRSDPSTRNELGECHYPSMFAASVACFPGGFRSMWPFFVVAGMRNPRYQPAIDCAKSKVSWENVVVSPEQFEKICMEHDIPCSEFFGAAVAVVYEQHRDMTWMKASLAMPKVMERNIEEAVKPRGIDDRRMFMQATRILPTPGTSVNIANVVGGPSLTQSGEPSGLPSFEADTLTLSEIVRQVEAAPQPALPEPVDVTPTEDSDV